MIIVLKHGYHKRYVYGGSGIFDTVASTLGRLVTSEAAKKAAAEVGKKVLETTAKNVGDVVSQKVKNLVKRKKKLDPKSTAILQKLINTSQVTPESLETLKQLMDTPETSLNNLIAGSGQAISIQKLARKLNGSGLKRI